MSASVILVAVDKLDAWQWIARTGIEPRAFVTVRSPHRARGTSAARITVTPRAADHPRLISLLFEVVPCMATHPNTVTPLDAALKWARVRATC